MVQHKKRARDIIVCRECKKQIRSGYAMKNHICKPASKNRAEGMDEQRRQP